MNTFNVNDDGAISAELHDLTQFTWWVGKYVIVTPRAYYHVAHAGNPGTTVQLWRFVKENTDGSIETVRRYLPCTMRVKLVPINEVMKS